MHFSAAIPVGGGGGGWKCKLKTYNHDVWMIKSPRAKIIVIPNSFLRSLSSQQRRRSVVSSIMPVCLNSVVVIAEFVRHVRGRVCQGPRCPGIPKN